MKTARNESATSNIVVFGDFLIDRSWIVEEPKNSSSQFHGSVPALKRVNPFFKDSRLGGPGMMISFLSRFLNESQRKTVGVFGIGSWDPADESNIQDLFSLGIAPNFKNVRLINAKNFAANRSQTTVKQRVHQLLSKKKLRLISRFDQDPILDCPEGSAQSATDELEEIIASLPVPESITAVVIHDLCKGMVTKDSLRVLARTLGRSPNRIWFIDSKNSKIQSILPQKDSVTFFTLNREEAGEIARASGVIGPEDIPCDRLPNRELLIVAKSLNNSLVGEPERTYGVIIKLDVNGACYLPIANSNSIELYSSRTVHREAEGIAAGDIFNARFIYEYVVCGKECISDAITAANIDASAWVSFCAHEWHTMDDRSSDIPLAIDFFSPESQRIVGRISRESVVDTYSLDDETRRTERPLNYALIVKEKSPIISLADGAGFLGRFMLTDLRQRRQLVQFKDVIKRYVEGKGPTRPLNCLISAPPGSGKSFLVKEIAKVTGCEVVEVNCAQVMSPEDFAESISRVQNVAPNRVPLLFLDEAESNEALYAQMLTPLWESKIYLRGGLRQWRERYVSILVVSQSGGVDSYCSHLASEKVSDRCKSKDLLSRLNGPMLTLGEGDRAPEVLTGRVYLFLQKVLEYHPDAVHLERGLLDLIFAAPEFNPRAVEYFAARMPGPVVGVCRIESVDAMQVHRLLKDLEYKYDAPTISITSKSKLALGLLGYSMTCKKLSLDQLRKDLIQVSDGN